MTKQEAIKGLKVLRRDFSGYKPNEEMFDMAIQALQQEPCDDCISRKETIRWVKTECNPYGKPTLDFESGKKVIEHLEQMPSAEPKRGKWEQAKDIEKEYAVCTNCKHHGEFYMDYCPNCGARMESDGE